MIAEISNNTMKANNAKCPQIAKTETLQRMQRMQSL